MCILKVDRDRVTGFESIVARCSSVADDLHLGMHGSTLLPVTCSMTVCNRIKVDPIEQARCFRASPSHDNWTVL